MENRFNGVTAIVTGGCRGIGLAIAERFASEGANVFALDYVIPEPDTQLSEITGLDQAIKCIQTDVTNEDSVKSAIESVLKETGRIDVLVNNAGITRDNLLMRLSEQDWDSVLDTNLKGAFLCTKAVIRTMMSQRSGRIINLGSIVGTGGNAGQANYSASKAGLIGFSKSIAKELASRNILVNVIAPGYVLTPMTNKLTEEQRSQFLSNIPLKRAAEPKDIANV
ncbi:MAG: 3-oxoacyl-[acyl-carrier protein] reductase, partial [Bacteroidota bacterium]|nr:3-oxoacyl-[acyl-carrier protein] reductase [Bacteroidota bacterium]